MPFTAISFRLRVLLASAAAAFPLAAQGTIAFTANPAPQVNAPQGLEGHALAVRSDGSMVLFGGAQAAGLLPGTYTSSNGTWTRRISILNPTERSEATLAFDRKVGLVLEDRAGS
jgi:hypothetical protein